MNLKIQEKFQKIATLKKSKFEKESRKLKKAFIKIIKKVN